MEQPMEQRDYQLGLKWVAIGALVLVSAVMLGAFGAHGLKSVLTAAKMLTYQTAVQYHFYHGFGLVLVGLIMLNIPPNKGVRWSAVLILLGVLLFSGSLYLMALFNITWFGIATPLGGVALIAAWLLLTISIFKIST